MNEEFSESPFQPVPLVPDPVYAQLPPLSAAQPVCCTVQAHRRKKGIFRVVQKFSLGCATLFVKLQMSVSVMKD